MLERFEKRLNVEDLVLLNKSNKDNYYDIQTNALWAICMLMLNGILTKEVSPYGESYDRVRFGHYIADIRKFEVPEFEDATDLSYSTDIEFCDFLQRVAIIERTEPLPNGIPSSFMYCTEWFQNKPWTSSVQDHTPLETNEYDIICENVIATKYIYLFADLFDELHLFCKERDIEQYYYCRENGGDFLELKIRMFEYARSVESYVKIVKQIGLLDYKVEFDTTKDLLDNLGVAVLEQRHIELPERFNESHAQQRSDEMEIPF
ncbi:MAG: hypothetical protein HXL57_00020 [Solobacterium sp.]|jgi:hypothetical protein|nr:hypothetical protein [Solobacterium sp.]DAX34817.1 MAG TPA: hypothetical protein [Caudoviricetes sp.]